MPNPFSVDPEALADAVKQMAEFQTHAEAMHEEIERVVAHLHVTWTGDAAAAHAEAHRHWTRGEAMMREALDQLQGAGKTAHANYQGASETNRAMWT